AELDLQYGITEVGDNQNLRLSGLVGGNFADGRGNALVGLEYSRRGIALQADRSIYKSRYANPRIGAGANNEMLSIQPTLVATTGQVTANPAQAIMDALYAGYAAPGTVPVN